MSRELICRELVPEVHATVDDAVGVLDQLLARYEGPSMEQGAADSGVFEAVFEELMEAPEPQGPSASQRIADVSFMARWELNRKRAAIDVAEDHDDEWSILSECCSTRRRVLEASGGVELVLCEEEGCTSVFEHVIQTEREIAVLTRHAFRSLMSSLENAEARAAEDLVVGIRLAGTGVAMLVGRDVYQELRVKDRIGIRRIQRRMMDWLRNPDEEEGRRLLSDASAFAALLMEVNQRPVLLEHDRAVLARLERKLAHPAVEDVELPRVLYTIRGRDPELDALIDGSVELHPRAWMPPVTRVLEQISASAH
ncbi:MAG: hypothetical protein H6712_08565 [Myxococcales bacterium]|nr:hypothetical protein [Myxococcales bacterium]MCB9713892.1 hypothetical protein [Myxococcales bacterium]